MTNRSKADSRNVMRAAQLTKVELNEVYARLDELQPSFVPQDEVSATIKEVVRRAIRRGVTLEQLNVSLSLTKLSISKHQFSELARDDRGKEKIRQAEHLEQDRPVKKTRHFERAQSNEQVELSEQARLSEGATSELGQKAHALVTIGEQNGAVEASNELGDKSGGVPDADQRGACNSTRVIGTQNDESLTKAGTSSIAGLSSSQVDAPVPGASHSTVRAALRTPTAVFRLKNSAPT